MLIKALGNNILAFLKKHFLPYLVKQAPVEENGVTLVLDEGVARQANRPFLWKRCILGDGDDTIDLSAGISGTLTLKGWTKVAGVWSYGDITTGLSGTTLTLQTSTYYKAIERYDDNVLVDTLMCEEDVAGGTVTTLYSNATTNNEFTITTGDITAVRVEQDDTPLLPLSGDMIGWGWAKALDLTQQVEDYTDGSPESLPWTPSTSLNGNNQLFTTPTFGQFRIQHRAATVVGDNTTSYIPTGESTNGFYSDADGTYITLYSNEANSGLAAQTNIEIESFSGANVVDGEILNGRYEFFYKTNNPFVIEVLSFVFEDAVEAAVIDADNVTDDPDGILAADYTANSNRYTIEGVLSYVQNVNANATKVQAIEDLFQQYTFQSVAEFEAASVAGGRLDICTRMWQRTVVSVDVNNRNILSSITDSQFTHNLPTSDGNGARSSAMIGVPMPSAGQIKIIVSPSYNVAEYGGDGNDVVNYFYFGNIRNITNIPKDSDASTDINGEALIYSGRKDFPLTPVDEPAYKGTTTDYGLINNIITLADTEAVEYGMLVTNYPTNADQGIVGDNTNNNRFIMFEAVAGRVFFKWSGDFIRFETGLDFTTIGSFFINVGFTKTNTTTITDCFVKVYDLDGTELHNSTVASTTVGSSNMNIGLVWASEIGGKRSQYESPYIWRKINGTLTHYWEYLGNNSLVIWDRVGGNHATITTSDITANQGTQDVYSSRLKDGWSEELYFDGTAKVEAASNTVQDETTGDFTLLAWVCLNDDSSDAAVDDDQGLIAKISIGPNVNGYTLYLASGKVRAEFVSSTTRFTTSIMTYDLNNNTNKWHLCAARFDRDGNLSATVVQPDGTIETQTIDISGENGNSITNTETFTLGNYFQFTDRDFFGFMSQAAKFSSLLTDAELTELHSQGKDYSFASDTGNYTSSANLTGHWIAPSKATDYWVDTQGNGDLTPTNLLLEYIPANLLNNGLDIFGNTLTHPSGTYLPSDIKLTSPAFRTLDTALQSNEELARDTTDANGNSVRDRLLIPISYNHSDKDFPCLKFNGVNTDYVTLKNYFELSNNVTHKWEVLIDDYNSLGTNTRQAFLGADVSGPVYMGLRGADRLFLYLGSSGLDWNTGYTFASLGEFKIEFEITASASYSSVANVDVTAKLYDSNGVLLYENSITSHLSSGYRIDTIGVVSDSNPLYHVDANVIWTKLSIDGTLTDWWVYTGNNSFLVQDVVGDNHGSITTADITLNQGEQDVFNPLVDGNNKIVECNNYRINYYGAYNVIDYSKEWDLVLEGLGAAYSSGYQFAGASANIRIQGNDLFIAASANSANRLVQFTGILPTSYDGEYVSMKFEFRNLGSNNAQITATININGNEYTQTQTQTTLSVNIPFDSYRIPNVIGNDSGYIQYYYTFNFTNVTDSLSYSIIENGVRIDTTTQLNEYGTSIKSIDILPQHPYNGLDIFDNTLTTPRTKERTKSLKYTDND